MYIFHFQNRIHALYGKVIWEVVTRLISLGMLPLQVRVESEGDAPMGIPATKQMSCHPGGPL